MFAGTSAGTMIMSSPMYGGGLTYGHLYFSNSVGLAQKKVSDGGINGTGLSDTRNGTKGLQYEDNGGMIPGFDFVDLLMDTHFDARGRLGRIIPGLVQTKKPIGVGVDESTCLYYNNGRGKVYGKNGVFIVDISKSLTDKSKKYFNMKDVSVSYLTMGDQYDFKEKVVTSSKSRITEPHYSGYTDSHDIFNSYECSLLATRLVDQTGRYNVGSSRIPSGYPSSAPKFDLVFYGSVNTKGYYDKDSKKYTADSFLVDVNNY